MCVIQTRATSHLSSLHHSRFKRQLSTSLLSGESFPLNIWPPLEYSLSFSLGTCHPHIRHHFNAIDWNIIIKRSLSILVAWSKPLDYLVSFFPLSPLRNVVSGLRLGGHLRSWKLFPGARNSWEYFSPDPVIWLAKLPAMLDQDSSSAGKERHQVFLTFSFQESDRLIKINVTGLLWWLLSPTPCY